MNFPMEEPLYQFLYWFVDTPGIGGVAVLLLVGAILLMIARGLYWITQGAKARETETYAYPTPALHHS